MWRTHFMMHFFRVCICLIWFVEEIRKQSDRIRVWYFGRVVDTATALHIPWDPLSSFMGPCSDTHAFRWPPLAAFCRGPPLGSQSNLAHLCRNYKCQGFQLWQAGPWLRCRDMKWNANSLASSHEAKLWRVTPILEVPCGIRQKESSSSGPCPTQTLVWFLSLLCPATLS